MQQFSPDLAVAPKMRTQIKATVLQKGRQELFFLFCLKHILGVLSLPGTGPGSHGQVRSARPTNTCVFTDRENRRLIIRGEVHFATHDIPPPFPLPRCQNFIINSLKCFRGRGVGEVGGGGGPGRLRRCDSSLAVIRSASTRQNTRLIVIIDAETAVDGCVYVCVAPAAEAHHQNPPPRDLIMSAG